MAYGGAATTERGESGAYGGATLGEGVREVDPKPLKGLRLGTARVTLKYSHVVCFDSTEKRQSVRDERTVAVTKRALAARAYPCPARLGAHAYAYARRGCRCVGEGRVLTFDSTEKRQSVLTKGARERWSEGGSERGREGSRATDRERSCREKSPQSEH